MEVTYVIPDRKDLSSEDFEILGEHLEKLANLPSAYSFGFPNCREIQLDESDDSFIVLDFSRDCIHDLRQFESIRRYVADSEGNMLERSLVKMYK